MKLKFLHCAAFLAIAALPLSAGVVNGGFETGDFTGWTQGGNLGFTSVDGFSAHSGNFGADMGPVGSDGSLSQMLTAAPGTWDFSFWLASDGGNFNDFTANFGGNTEYTVVDAGGFGYSLFSFTGISAGANPSIVFTFRQDPAFWHLDDVSATQTSSVPEPGTMGLLLSGLGAAFFARRRRKA